MRKAILSSRLDVRQMRWILILGTGKEVVAGYLAGPIIRNPDRLLSNGNRAIRIARSRIAAIALSVVIQMLTTQK